MAPGLSLLGSDGHSGVRTATGAETQVRALAITRVAIGAVLVAVPGPALRAWLGGQADSPAARLLARSVGGRDIALGLGAIFALRHGASVGGWLEGGLVADATDGLAMVAASRRLPAARVLAALAPTIGAVGLGGRLVSRLRAP